MGDILNSKGHFELKKLLDGASGNLPTILNALETKYESTASPREINDAQAFLAAFGTGSIEPFYRRLEDSDLLYDMMNADSPQYGLLLRNILKYGTSGHYRLSIALSECADQCQLAKVVSHDGFILHSFLAHPEKPLLLDVNGVHAHSDMLKEWQGRQLGKAVTISPTTVQELMMLGPVEMPDLDIALGDFGIVAGFMLKNIEALTEIPLFEEDLDDNLDFEP